MSDTPGVGIAANQGDQAHSLSRHVQGRSTVENDEFGDRRESLFEPTFSNGAYKGSGGEPILQNGHVPSPPIDGHDVLTNTVKTLNDDNSHLSKTDTSQSYTSPRKSILRSSTSKRPQPPKVHSGSSVDKPTRKKKSVKGKNTTEEVAVIVEPQVEISRSIQDPNFKHHVFNDDDDIFDELEIPALPEDELDDLEYIRKEVEATPIPDRLAQLRKELEDQTIMVGAVSVGEVQLEEERIEQDRMRIMQAELRHHEKKQVALVEREFDARRRLEAMRAEVSFENRKDALAMLARANLAAREQQDAFRKAEGALKDVLALKQGRLEAQLGTLACDGDVLRGRQYRVEWERAPRLMGISNMLLRAVKNKLPAGRYVMLVTLYDRLGGVPLRWSTLKDLNYFNRTRMPVRHHGRYFDVELSFRQRANRVLLACPSTADASPGMCLIFELFQLRNGTTYKTDRVVAWGAFPLFDSTGALVRGLYKLPLLRGEVDHGVDKYSELERRMGQDLDAWLCNMYFEAEDWPRTIAGRREYDVSVEVTDAQLQVSEEARHPIGAEWVDVLEQADGGDEDPELAVGGVDWEELAAARMEPLRPLPPRATATSAASDTSLSVSVSVGYADSDTSASEDLLEMVMGAHEEDAAHGVAVENGRMVRGDPRVDAEDAEDDGDSDALPLSSVATAGSAAAFGSEWTALECGDEAALLALVHAEEEAERQGREELLALERERLQEEQILAELQKQRYIHMPPRTHPNVGPAQRQPPRLERQPRSGTLAVVEEEEEDEEAIMQRVGNRALPPRPRAPPLLPSLQVMLEEEEEEEEESMLSMWAVMDESPPRKDTGTASASIGLGLGLDVDVDVDVDGDGDGDQLAIRSLPRRARAVSADSHSHGHGAQLSPMDDIPSAIRNRRRRSALLMSESDAAIFRQLYDNDAPSTSYDAVLGADAPPAEGDAQPLTFMGTAVGDMPASLREKLVSILPRSHMEVSMQPAVAPSGDPFRELDALVEDAEEEERKAREDARAAEARIHNKTLFKHTYAVCAEHPADYRFIDDSRAKLRYVWHELKTDLGSHRWSEFEFWALLLTLFLMVWLRVYVRYLGQYLFLQGADVPLQRVDVDFYTMRNEYNDNTVDLSTQLGAVVMPCLANLVVYFFFTACAWVYQTAFRSFPLMLSRILLTYGLACTLDPALVLLVDLCGGAWEGDVFKLYNYYHFHEGNGAPGALLTVAIYLVYAVMAAATLYQYLLAIHGNARIVDLHHRLHAPDYAFFLPQDQELSLRTLRWIITKARRASAGTLGSQFAIKVTAYSVRDHLDPHYKATTMHLCIYKETASGSQKVWRQFVRDSQGAIVELFEQSEALLEQTFASVEQAYDLAALASDEDLLQLHLPASMQKHLALMERDSGAEGALGAYWPGYGYGQCHA